MLQQGGRDRNSFPAGSTIAKVKTDCENYCDKQVC